MFDWVSFLERNRIEYITSGHNVRKNNIGIRCPWCGDDPSYHLGISLTGRGYHCWRDDSHSGIAPQRLIVALIGCSYEEANRLAGSETIGFATSESTFSDDVSRQLGVRIERTPRANNTVLVFPKEFRPINKDSLCRLLVCSYLSKRGYSEAGIDRLSRRFGLRWAYTGKFAYRVVVPVYMKAKLVNWTGRTIVKDDDLRYRSLSSDPEQAAKELLPVAPRNIKDCLLDYDELLNGGETLVVCEGPFDAMRVTFFGERYGIYGTCLFNKSASPAQVDLLWRLYDRFKERLVAFDRNADLDAFKSFPDELRFGSLRIPHQYKDPAEFDIDGFRKVFRIAA